MASPAGGARRADLATRCRCSPRLQRGERAAGPTGRSARATCSHYFAPDQLYDLEADPGEQTNLADDLAYAEVLAEMWARLVRYLEGVKHPFDLSVDPFLTSTAYQALTEVTRADDRIYRTYWYQQNAY